MKRFLPVLLSITLLLILTTPVRVKAGDLTLKKATISNIAIPQPGTSVSDYIDTTLRPDSEADKYYVSKEDCYWSNESKTEMYPSNTFSKDSVYYYSVVLKTFGSYVFDSACSLNIIGGAVDPGMQIMIGEGGRIITFKNAFKVMCGSGEAPPIVTSVTLTKNTFYYNGKVQKPKASQINVTDEYGNHVDSSYYTVEYSGNSKKVGVYTVKVTGKDPGKSSASAVFTINPSSPRSVRAAGAGGSVKVKWSKPKSGKPDYYDVFVYKDSSCDQVVTSAKVTGTSKTIGGLKSGTTYYVKVDCFVKSDAGYLVSKPSKAIQVLVR